MDTETLTHKHASRFSKNQYRSNFSNWSWNVAKTKQIKSCTWHPNFVQFWIQFIQWLANSKYVRLTWGVTLSGLLYHYLFFRRFSGKKCCTNYICDVCQFLHNWSNQEGISYNNDPDSYFPSTDPLFGSFFKTRPLLAHPGFVCEFFLRLAATLHGLVRSTQSYTFSYKDCKQHLFAMPNRWYHIRSLCWT